MVLLRRLGVGALFVGAVIGGAMFSNANEQDVSVDYLFGTLRDVPLWLALVGSFALGVVGTALAMLGRLTRASLAQRRYRKTLASLETEIHQLRNLPLEAGRPEELDAPRASESQV